MKKKCFALLSATAASAILAGCSHLNGHDQKPAPDASAALGDALHALERKYAPDNHMGIFAVGLERQNAQLVLTGEVDRAEARMESLQAAERAGVKATYRIAVLPAAELGDKTWGLACLSVASGREHPDHKAEMATQILMGHAVRLWKSSSFWSLVQSSDGYLAWLERGAFVRCTREVMDAWNASPLLIVTAFEDCVRESPQPDAQPVSDVVMGNLVKSTGAEGDWLKVELPDQRAGFLPRKSVVDYGTWKQSCHATAENIERTARMFLGRPYL